MDILFVASRVPYPPLQGDRARGYNVLKGLRERGHQVTLVSPVDGPVDGEVRGHVEALTESWWQVPMGRASAVLRLAKAPLARLPLQTLYSFPEPMRSIVQHLCTARPFDLVHIQLARMGPAIDAVRDLPTVLDFIDALSVNMQRRAMRERWPVRLFFELEARRMASYERALVNCTNRQLISSESDRLAVGGSDRTVVIPNGVDLVNNPFSGPARTGGEIVFTGRMAYFPNEDAAVYFAREVLPRIRREMPDARFRVVGSDPPRAVQRLARDPAVTITGYVPSIASELSRAAVAVAPMRSGSGMQFKVIEAMAVGAPVVATSYALGGLDARNGEHLLVANGAEELARSVLKLLQCPDLGRRLALSARRLVEERYTWESSVAKLELVYEEAMREGPRRQGEGR